MSLPPKWWLPALASVVYTLSLQYIRERSSVPPPKSNTKKTPLGFVLIDS